MKENLEQDQEKEQEIQMINEFEQLLYDEFEINENNKIDKEINLSIYNFSKKKSENFKLINEEKEILLCQEEMFNEIKSKKENKDEDVKIQELFKGEDNDSVYYLNKTELRKKYLRIKEEDLNEDEENMDNLIDNKDEREMLKLYKEVQLKHPRKIVDGKIQRYSFFSWSGFFCCNKPDYMSLGEAYITYFNTIKLLIIFFFIIAIINSYLMKLFREFSSVYNITEEDKLLKSTFGNTIIRYFNSTIKIFYKEKYYSGSKFNIYLDCGENRIGDFVSLQRGYFDHFIIESSGENKTEFEYSINPDGLKVLRVVDYLNYDLKNYNCSGRNTCNIETYIGWIYDVEDFPFYNYTYGTGIDNYEVLKDTFIYSCISDYNHKKTKDIDTNLEKKLKRDIIIITIITIIILVIFYILFKKAISRDKKAFQKNKIFINNYTLVLHNLKINSEDYNQEMSDLIAFINNTIQKYKHLFISYQSNYKEITDLNIFDISISIVNAKKIKTFEKIKKLKGKIDDIFNDNESIKQKVKNNIRGLYRSMHNIYANLSDKEKIDKKKDKENQDNQEYKGNQDNNKNQEKIDDKDNEDNIIEENNLLEFEEGYNLEKQIKLGKNKTLINENINRITVDISKLHKECNLNNYADIYITFRNQLIPTLLYDIYNKNKFIRFFYYLFCQGETLRKYYYKNQWLNFYLAKENPSDIKWENCYVTSCKKFGKRLLSIIISTIFIILIAVIMALIKMIENENETIIQKLMILLTQLINIVSSKVLKIFTKSEKYGSKSKEIFSDIRKYFWLNFLLSFTLFFRNENVEILSYRHFEDYILMNKVVIENMIWSILFSQASCLFFFAFNLLKRFSDSKYNNGTTTELKNKIKYEELYLGPEFPFEERYGVILVNMSLCLFFGSNSPVIFYFFVGFLIATFIVDKFLMIYYYRKPPLYGSLLSEKIQNYFFLAILLYVYGLFYHISNPYAFNNYLLKYASQNKSYSDTDIQKIFGYIDSFLNPFTLFYFILCESDNNSDRYFLYYNFNTNILLPHLFVFVILFLNPTSFVKKMITPKSKFLSFLNISPVEIGTIYSLEDLKEYYEIKKLQLINLIIDSNKREENKDNYYHLINNYMFVLKYIKQNIDNKSNKQTNIIDISNNNNIDEYISLKSESKIKGHQLQISGDVSYNQNFISKYKIYSNFSLMKNI